MLAISEIHFVLPVSFDQAGFVIKNSSKEGYAGEAVSWFPKFAETNKSPFHIAEVYADSPLYVNE